MEVRAPEGVEVLAEPVYFTVADGMKEVPRLVMENFSVIVEIEKTLRIHGRAVRRSQAAADP